jgi:hypothetical protein
MDVTVRTLGHTVALLKPEVTTTLHDGPDGWTITEVLGHLRDFDGYFRGRAQLILEQENPALPAYDHEALAIAFRYNEQDFRTVYAELLASREQTRALFAALSDEQWARAGVHPEYGHFTLTNAVMQVGLHDAIHIEQIGKILTQ